MTELTVLGDPPNVTARLAGAAAAGEILVSETALALADMTAPIEHRTLDLKGKAEPLTVGVLRA